MTKLDPIILIERGQWVVKVVELKTIIGEILVNSVSTTTAR